MKKRIAFLLLSIFGAMMSNAYAVSCADIDQYSNGSSYSSGSQVQNNGTAYTCTVGGWCTIGGPYEPGVGWAWTNSWNSLGACDDDGNDGGDDGNGDGDDGGNGDGSGDGGDNCTPWQAGTQYNEGDIVSYNGAYYVAEHSNPGYDPTISTWFWDPTPSCGDGGNGDDGNGDDGNGGSGSGNLLVGYWHNFNNGSGNIRLRDVSSNWDWIQVSFAEPTSATSGDMQFSPYNATIAEFKADIQFLQNQGKKVLISIGGANGQVRLDSTGAANTFVSTMTNIINTYGFDGFDIDFEGHSLQLNAGDSSFMNPTTPLIINTINAIRQTRNNANGKLLTFAPETFFVQLGHSFYGGTCLGCDTRAGAYLPVIYALRNELSMLNVQNYNSGSITGLDGQYHSMGGADFHVAMGDMLLAGFSVAGTGEVFPALPASKVGIGLPANVNAGGGYTSEAEVQAAVGYLAGTRSAPTGYTKLSGDSPDINIMSWSINWDQFNNYQFSNSHRAFLDSL